VLACAGAAAAGEPRPLPTVLTIHLGQPDHPSNVVLNATIPEGLRSGSASPFEYFAEYLDSERVTGGDAGSALGNYIAEKYGHRRFDLVIAPADPPLQFVLEHRRDLFPDAAIVYSGVRPPGEELRITGHGLTGVLVHSAYAETMRLALDLHPDVRRVYVIAHSGNSATAEAVRTAFAEFSPGVTLTYLDSDTVPALLTAVKAIPAGSLIVYLWYSVDEPDHSVFPDAIARLVSQAATVPVYGTSDFYIGTGVVGGVVRLTSETGHRIGELGRQILDGARARDLPIETARLVPTFDGRQLSRWGIDEARLPAGSQVSLRPPSLWRDYRGTVLAAVTAGVVQFGLIVGLLYQRRARRAAEVEGRHHLAMAAHVGRQLAMGEMAASVAHELNQPLNAILHNAEAADRLLESNRASTETLREILADIRSDDARASLIIERQRAMLRKHESEQKAIDLNAVVRESVAIVAHDALVRAVRIETDLSLLPCAIVGDQILLQQVAINLLINGMDAVADAPPSRRLLVVRTTVSADRVEFSVIDAGPGIAPEVLAHLFEPFMTTKAKGMGMGLTIVRSIVRSHRGEIEAGNNPTGGATFKVVLPLREAPSPKRRDAVDSQRP
jgi:signal transduction histidine kinase